MPTYRAYDVSASLVGGAAALYLARVSSAEPAYASERTRVCSFSMDPGGFVRATMDEGARFTLDDAVAAVDAMFRVGGAAARPVLVDMRGLREQTREARAYFASDSASMRLRAVALWAGSPVSRMIGNFFLGIGVQRTPTRLFTSESDAIAWLVRYVS